MEALEGSVALQVGIPTDGRGMEKVPGIQETLGWVFPVQSLCVLHLKRHSVSTVARAPLDADIS